MILWHKKKQIQITKHVTSVNRTTDNYIRRLQESKSEKITQICWYQANICLKSFCWYPFIPRTNEDNRRSTYTLLTNYNTISTIFLSRQSWKFFEYIRYFVVGWYAGLHTRVSLFTILSWRSDSKPRLHLLQSYLTTAYPCHFKIWPIQRSIEYSLEWTVILYLD